MDSVHPQCQQGPVCPAGVPDGDGRAREPHGEAWQSMKALEAQSTASAATAPLAGRRGTPVRVGRVAAAFGGRIARLLRGFALARAGAAIVEFALVMPPFILMTFGIIETTLVMFVATHLEGSVHEAARQIRTGNVQGAADPLDAFRTLLCADLEVVVACDDRLVIDVRTFDNFGNVDFPPFTDADGKDDGSAFTPGDAGEIVLVRVAYNWNIVTPMLGHLLADDGTSRKLLMATAAFRNEPFNGPLP